MAATNETSNLQLSQFVGTDKPDWLTDYNGDMLKIDAAYGDVNATAEQAAANAQSAATSAAAAAEDAAEALAGIAGAIEAAQAATTAAEQATSAATSAVSIANGAASTAQSAAGDATSALSIAQNAKQTAESAQAAAAQAVTDAQAAASDAQTASASATQAASDAAAAAAIAQGVQADVQQAQTTANSALTAANKANNFVPDVSIEITAGNTWAQFLQQINAGIDYTRITPKSKAAIIDGNNMIMLNIAKVYVDPDTAAYSGMVMTSDDGELSGTLYSRYFKTYFVNSNGFKAFNFSGKYRNGTAETSVQDMTSFIPATGTTFKLQY